MTTWIDVCGLDEIEPEDVIRFDHAGRTFAVYRAPDGLVIGDTIECPKHNGRFNYRTGAPLRAPVCVALATCPARIRDGRIEIAPRGAA
ncbi:MAG: Rieske family ferredoxin [Tabrizicola sp.]